MDQKSKFIVISLVAIVFGVVGCRQQNYLGYSQSSLNFMVDSVKSGTITYPHISKEFSYSLNTLVLDSSGNNQCMANLLNIIYEKRKKGIRSMFIQLRDTCCSPGYQYQFENGNLAYIYYEDSCTILTNKMVYKINGYLYQFGRHGKLIGLYCIKSNYLYKIIYTDKKAFEKLKNSHIVKVNDSLFNNYNPEIYK